MQDWGNHALAWVQWHVHHALLGPSSFLSLRLLLPALAMAIVWLCLNRRRLPRPRLVARALFPDRYLTSRSAQADWIAAALSFTVVSLGWIGALVNADDLAGRVASALAAMTGHGAPLALPGAAARALATLVAWLAFEFAYYLDHWLKHRVAFFWEYHKVHHTAETLSPVTMYRVHPVDGFVYMAIVLVVGAVATGGCIWAMGPAADPFRIDGTNAILAVAIMLVVTLQHSQLWIPLRGLAGRLVMSPAHHQLHHSRDPAHFNCNLGYTTALWDWAFGTLRVPERRSPRLRFGVEGLGYDPHSLAGFYLRPLFESLCVLIPARSRAAVPAEPVPEAAPAPLAA